MMWFTRFRRIKVSAGKRDSRYSRDVLFDDFRGALLAVLNLKNVRYLVSYDGRLGSRSYGKPLPVKLRLTLVEIEAGRSSQATLLGRDEMTVESFIPLPQRWRKNWKFIRQCTEDTATNKCN